VLAANGCGYGLLEITSALSIDRTSKPVPGTGRDIPTQCHWVAGQLLGIELRHVVRFSECSAFHARERAGAACVDNQRGEDVTASKHATPSEHHAVGVLPMQLSAASQCTRPRMSSIVLRAYRFDLRG